MSQRVRGMFTVGLLALLSSALFGWVWVGHLPSAKMQISRALLTLVALAALTVITILWSARPQKAVAEF